MYKNTRSNVVSAIEGTAGSLAGMFAEGPAVLFLFIFCSSFPYAWFWLNGIVEEALWSDLLPTLFTLY